MSSVLRQMHGSCVAYQRLHDNAVAEREHTLPESVARLRLLET